MGKKVNNAKNHSCVSYLFFHIFSLLKCAVIPDKCIIDIAWYPWLISRKILIGHTGKITSCSFKLSPCCTSSLLEVLHSTVWYLKVGWNGAIKEGQIGEAKNLIRHLKMLSLFITQSSKSVHHANQSLYKHYTIQRPGLKAKGCGHLINCNSPLVQLYKILP